MRRTNIRKLPHEVFDLLEHTKKVDERVKILQDNGTGEIQTILQGAFHPNVIFDLPAGAPAYKADGGPAGQQQTPLHKHIPNLLKCVRGKGGLDENDRYTRLRRENIFLRLLEIAHEKDAEILIAMKDKKLSKLYPSLTASLVRKAFPTILPDK
jgi:hypothetical protein